MRIMFTPLRRIVDSPGYIFTIPIMAVYSKFA